MRDRVFISHANPEDNHFASWLASKLDMLGYKVWVDLFEFNGGEPMWPTIEQLLRNDSAKLIYLFSNNSYVKQGVLDELNLANTVSSTIQDPSFIVPIRIDNVAFSNLPITVHSRYTLDAHSKPWASQLKLITELLEEDSVPCYDKYPNSIIDTTNSFTSSTPEPYLLNMLPLLKEPDTIYIYNSNSFDNSNLDETIIYGVHSGYIYSYTDPKTLISSNIISNNDNYVSINSNEHWHNLGSSRIPVSRLRTNLIHKSVDHYLDRIHINPLISTSKRGFRVFNDFNKYSSFTSIIDIEGNKTRAKLAGIFKKYRWHLSIRAVLTSSPIKGLVIKLRPVYKNENGVYLDDPKLQHRLYRSHTKTWFNNKWRRLLLAACKDISNGHPVLKVLGTGPAELVFDSRPLVIEAPVSYTDALVSSEN